MVKKGFTLIELLVVISIIGILAALTYVSFLNSQMTARDTARRSDLNQYKISLEQYANNKNGAYFGEPSSNWVNASTLCVASALNMSACPDDPIAANHYQYSADASGLNYKLYAKLESSNPVAYWEVCSSGKTGTVQGPSAPGNISASLCDVP